jgi:peroxygenase
MDTYRGFRGFGWSFILCFFAMVVIHGGLSYPTVPGWLPDPFFRIHIANVHKAKHGSDSMTYDNEGRFRPQQFEDFFSKFDKDKKGGVTLKEVVYALRAQALVFDFFGFSATCLECETSRPRQSVATCKVTNILLFDRDSNIPSSLA